jgi:hypothetical protein
MFMKSMKEDQPRISKPEKSRMFKEMQDYVMDGIEVWQKMNHLSMLKENSPELYNKQKADLLSKKNIYYVLNIAAGISDDDLKVRKEAIMLLRERRVDDAEDDTEVKLELTAIMDNALEDTTIRLEAGKALVWHTLQ